MKVIVSVLLYKLILLYQVTVVHGFVSFGCNLNNGAASGDETKQCPCVKDGSRKCMPYDHSKFASSLDEAMFTFPNLVSVDRQPLFDKENEQANAKIIPMGMSMSIAKIHPEEHVSGCVTHECKSCKLSIVNGMLQNGGNNSEIWREREKLTLSLGTEEGSCSQDEPTTAPPQQSKSQQSQGIVDKIIGVLNGNRVKRKANGIEEEEDSSNSTQILGTWTNIGCDYRRGEALDHADQWCGLCNLCWRWRRLPDEYFPQYLNEVSCDDKDNQCLSGFGSCRPILSSISILRNYGSKTEEKWEKATISTVTACECQVKIGTALHDLVQR